MNVVHCTGSSVAETKDTTSERFSSDHLHWRINTVQIVLKQAPREKSVGYGERSSHIHLIIILSPATLCTYCTESFVLCSNVLSFFKKRTINQLGVKNGVRICYV
jgi:hypothetical protein